MAIDSNTTKAKHVADRQPFIWMGGTAIVLCSLVSALAVRTQGLKVQVTLAVSVLAALFNLLAIPLFLSGIKQFKEGLQRAYIILCIGVGTFGLAQLQLPLVNLFNWAFWVNSGGIAIPYLVGVFGMFWGMRLVAKLLDIRSLWSSPFIAVLVSLIVSVIGSFLPHIHLAESRLAFDLSLGLTIWNAVFITFATVLAYKIRQKIGASYARSMVWLCAALSTISFAGWLYSISQLTTTTGYWYYDYSMTIVPFDIGAIVLVIAGYSFSRIDVLSGSDSRPSIATNSRELDVVLYLASLASNPSAIDIILDDVRFLTSGMQPGEQLSAADQQKLFSVRQRLEEYLVHVDPLRPFTYEELRQKITQKFGM